MGILRHHSLHIQLETKNVVTARISEYDQVVILRRGVMEPKGELSSIGMDVLLLHARAILNSDR